jgi:hypothetical protein
MPRTSTRFAQKLPWVTKKQNGLKNKKTKAAKRMKESERRCIVDDAISECDYEGLRSLMGLLMTIIVLALLSQICSNTLLLFCQVDSIYTDCSKVFNKVRHRLLLDKMSTDVEPSRCQWLASNFSGRIQRVRMADCVSRDIFVTSGVPQSSHSRPLCFI